MWMKLIDNIIINQLGLHTTTHSRCIYRRLKDGETQLILRQVDDFIVGCKNKQFARNLFNDIGKKIQFPSKVEQGIIPFEFLGIVTNCNGVGITQTPDYIEIFCKNYIARLLKLHGWDTKSPVESTLKLESTSTLDEVTSTTVTARDENYVNQHLNHACGANEAKSVPLKFSLNAMNHHESPGSNVSDQTKFLQVSKFTDSSADGNYFSMNAS